MAENTDSGFERWLMLRGKLVFVGLLGMNLLVGLVFVNQQQLPSEVAAKSSELTLPIGSLSEVEQLQPIVEAHPHVEAERVCRIWGPENDELAFAQLVRSLTESGSNPRVLESKFESAPDYIVAIIDINSSEHAGRVSAELSALKIDSYVVRQQESDELKLSVGVFSQQKRAVAQLERIVRLGYTARIEPLIRVQTVFNLVAHVSADSAAFNSSVAPCQTIAQGS